MTVIITAGKGIAKYAPMLEFGTSKMAPRPFFFAALEKNRQWIIDRINQAVNKGIQRGSK